MAADEEKTPLIHPSTFKKEKPKKVERNKSAASIEAQLLGIPKKKLRSGLAVSNFFRDLHILWPFIWPFKSFRIQLQVVGCLLILVVGRIVNLYVPIYSKYAIDALTPASSTTANIAWPWQVIGIWGVLKLFQGTGAFGGILNCIRGILWLSASQYTGREVQIELFKHLHKMSLRWHLSRRTGEVLRVMDRGMQSVTQLLTLLLFQIVPVIFDIIIAVVYFATNYNWMFAVICAITMILYLLATVFITEFRTRARRKMNAYDNAQRAKAVDSLLNFETVKYYNNEAFEHDRYWNAIVTYQKSEYTSQALMYLTSTAQAFIITAGTVIGCLLCAYFVATHQQNLTVGDYALFVQYIAQLYGPLNIIGMLYAMIQQYFIDMENMVDLMREPVEIEDAPDAPEFKLKAGRIEFKDISFHYDPKKTILDNVSFTVEPGQKVALVGPSGAGKSTIIRLLFRFYELNSGTILIDGQDIAHVQQKSLRRYIGVVPQDTVLFNDTIRYNVKYGRTDATDAEIDDATTAADIHDRILSFPNGYNTDVGERGLKLSGGEKQRVAIARTLLKSPAFVLLDEATSALDTKTERNIQASLERVCKGRTTLIVAHRLSTIVDCDQILVLKDGGIFERGTHEALIGMNGLYSSMWAEQSSGAAMPTSGSGSQSSNGDDVVEQDEEKTE